MQLIPANLQSLPLPKTLSYNARCTKLSPFKSAGLVLACAQLVGVSKYCFNTKIQRSNHRAGALTFQYTWRSILDS